MGFRLKSLFTTMARLPAIWIAYQEKTYISELQRTRKYAEEGYFHVAARGGAMLLPVSTEKAQEIIKDCDYTLARIAERRRAKVGPQP